MVGRIVQCPGKLAGVLTVAVAVVVSVVLAGAASAAHIRRLSTPGTLEICKSAANGAAGTSFTFDVQRGSASPTPVSVDGGTCASGISLDPGTYKITEERGSDWVVVGDTVVPDSAFVGENLRAGLVKVSVVAGQETQVTIDDAQAAATLKVCKWSSSPALQGRQFSFSVGSQTVQAVAGDSPDTAGCSQALSVQIGSKLKITEAVPANEAVAGIVGSPGSIVVSSSGSRATVRTVAGANVVTFDNEPVGPPQNGYLEVCKDAADGYVHGAFHFELTTTDGLTNLDAHANGTTGEDVLVGQCSGPIQVPAGPVLVTESDNGSTQLDSVWAEPGNALGVVNLVNQTAVTVVPVASDTTGEVQLHFVNKTPVATLKVCKYLAGNSQALAGRTFHFTVESDLTGDAQWPVSIIAPAGTGGACKIVTDDYGRPVLFPVGATATATELLGEYPFVSGDGNGPGADDEQSTEIGRGINNVSFHNVALGQLEICKKMATIFGESSPDSSLGQSFTFNYVSADGQTRGTVRVAGGLCSMPQVVPAGIYTVSEDLSKLQVRLGTSGTKVNAFQFVASDARGPFGDNRCVPQQSTAPNLDLTGPNPRTIVNTNCGNPLKVLVPYYGSSDPVAFGETLVTVWNKLTRGEVKLCKQVTSDSTASLGSVPFAFTWAADTGGANGTGSATLKPGTCTGLQGNFPLAKDSALDPNTVTVTETGPVGIAHVYSASLTGGSPAGPFGSNFGTDLDGTVPYSVSFDPGPGPNVVTYTNQSNPA